MNTVTEQWISNESVMEEPGSHCQAYDQIGQAYSTKSSYFFSIVNLSMVRLKARKDSLVAGIFRRSPAADADFIDKALEERLRQEIKKIDMNCDPHVDEATGWFYL